VQSRRFLARELCLISLIAVAVILLFALDGQKSTTANHDNMVLPWDPAEDDTWHVCVGYNASVPVPSHQGEQKFSLDLVADASDVLGLGCKLGGSTSTDKKVITPTDGKIAWIGSTQPDVLCIDTQDGYSLKMGHLTVGKNPETGEPFKSGDTVSKNHVLGVVLPPDESSGNNGIAHIHIRSV
jgi:hypothetical protein